MNILGPRKPGRELVLPRPAGTPLSVAAKEFFRRLLVMKPDTVPLGG